LVMESTVQPERFAERAEAILETWGGWPSDEESLLESYELAVRFVAAEHVRHGSTYIRQSNSKGKTTDLIYALRAAQEEFQDRLAYIAKGDDITFWWPQHLIWFLQSRGDAGGVKQAFIGRKLTTPSKDSFVSGGAGFVLSATTARSLVETWQKECSWRLDNSFMHTSEDVALAKCTTVYMDPPLELSDSELFLAYGPIRSLTNDVDSWYTEYRRNAGKELPPCCSSKSVTFHYIESNLARFLWKCHKDQQLECNTWPPHLGGYIKRPKTEEQKRLFLDFMRSIQASVRPPFI